MQLITKLGLKMNLSLIYQLQESLIEKIIKMAEIIPSRAM